MPVHPEVSWFGRPVCAEDVDGRVLCAELHLSKDTKTRVVAAARNEAGAPSRSDDDDDSAGFSFTGGFDFGIVLHSIGPWV